MILRVSDFEGLKQFAKDKRIILFGAGVIGSCVTSELLKTMGLVGQVAFCIDNDSSKWGTYIEVAAEKIEIVSPRELNNFGANAVILINMSRYADALAQLEAMDCTKEMSCYIIPMLCIENYKRQPLIPKRIHYMWFGKKKIPEHLQKCIDSWQKFCPDYELVRWDESNYDVRKCQYMKQAYETRKYGFVPDYARLDILYNYGGIYMDTDVELVRSLDDLLYQEAFCSVEKWQIINFGGCSGAVKGQPGIKKFMDAWEERSYYRDDGTLDPISSGIVDTRVALDNGYVINGQIQTVMGMVIYTYDYFHPYDYMTGRLDTTCNTHAIHHFNGGWLDKETDTKLRNIEACGIKN